MTKILMALAVTLSSCFAMAAEIRTEVKVKGINEAVMIQHLGTNWGYTERMTGFSMGTARTDLVPVTREAAQVLQSLKKGSRYNCIIQNSTYVAETKDSEIVGGTFFVLDIDCN